MPLFSKPKVILWPKAKSVEIYIDKKENNNLSFDLNLWDKCSEGDLQSLSVFLKEKKVTSCSVLVPDDVVFTRAFIYDSKITQIDKKEVIGLAESFLHFKIDDDSIEYQLIQGDNKTIIQSSIFDKKKFDSFKENLNILNLKVESLKSVSFSIASIINTFFNKEFFLIYPLNTNEYTLLLAKGNSVYLTSNLKGSSLDIQKIINYSNLYFSEKTTKLFLPKDKDIEIISTTKLEETKFDDSQIAREFNKSSNFPLPVLGAIIKPFNSDTNSKPKKTKMENKKNILPIIAVFITTAAIVSMIIWFVVNKNNTKKTEIEEAEITPTVEEITPTEMPTPTPTIAEISKKLKLQVLNATDINGQAATVKAKLTSLGFDSIAVGNSKEKVAGNVVKMKASLSTASAYFQNKLATDFPADYSTDLKETSTYDVIFIIGTNLSTGAAVTSTESAVTPTKAKTTITPTATKSATITPTKALTPTPTI